MLINFDLRRCTYEKNANFLDKQLKAWSPEDKQNIWELSGLHEGDIMLSSLQDSNKNGLLNDKLRWQDGIVPYYINDDDFGKLIN